MPRSNRIVVSTDPIIKVDDGKPGKHVVAIHFRPNFGKVTDEDLVNLKEFPNLQSLELPDKAMITDAGLPAGQRSLCLRAGYDGGSRSRDWRAATWSGARKEW